VVTDTGGVLSHAAIIARERRIPAVVGLPDATTTIHDSTLVTINGSTGTVTTTDT
jgi:pyruvate,water dikinase